MRRLWVSIILAMTALAAWSATALAAGPNNQACFGEDASTYAAILRPLGQTLIAPLAHSPNGLGDNVQAHLAGLIPDEAFPNSCND